MHHIEGIGCGLPYLYTSEGGGLKEAGEFGLEFKDFGEFKIKLEEMTKNHRLFYDKIKNDFIYYNKNIFPEYYKIIKENT